VGQWKGSCLECTREWKPCTFNGKLLVLHFPDGSCDKGSSKHQETAELLTGEALVLDTLGVLMDEVIWLWMVVNQHGKLIISSLRDGKKGSMEEVGDQEQEPKKE